MFEKSLLKDCKLKTCEGYYRLIIMDLGMPIKDGFQASTEILQLQKDLTNLKRKSGDEKRINNKECDIVALTAF